MQYELLIIIILLLLIIIGGKNIISLQNIKKYNKVQSEVDIELIREKYFFNIEEREFISTWKALAAVLKVSHDKLCIDDEIKDFSKMVPFENILLDDLEEFFMNKGAAQMPDNLLSMKVKDVLKVAFEKNKIN